MRDILIIIGACLLVLVILAFGIYITYLFIRIPTQLNEIEELLKEVIQNVH